MKHWLFYIEIPKEKIIDIPILAIKLHYNNGSGTNYTGTLQESEDATFVYGLYGWTADKDIAHLFSESRNPKYFHCVKESISEDTTEWEMLRSSYRTFEIIRVGYSDEWGEKNYVMPMTRFEDEIVSEENGDDAMCAIIDQMFKERACKRKPDGDFMLVLDIFNKELEMALDTLGWSELIMEHGFADADLCMTGFGRSDDLDYLVDRYYSNASYQLGLNGVEMSHHILDPVATYILILGELLI